MTKINGNSTACREKRIEWLLRNPDLWKNKINPYEPKQYLLEINTLAQAIHGAGLYSPKTIIQDIRIGVIKLLQILQPGKLN